MQSGLEDRMVRCIGVAHQCTLNRSVIRVPMELAVAVINGDDKRLPQVCSTPVASFGLDRPQERP